MTQTIWHGYTLRLHESHEPKSYGNDGIACRLCGIRDGDSPKDQEPCPAVTCPTCHHRYVPGKDL